MKRILLIISAAALLLVAAGCGQKSAGVPKVDESILSLPSPDGKLYNEEIDPMAQIDAAVQLAGRTDRLVICQVGGNWCRWCLMFAKFISSDEEISSLIEDNFVYIHVNYPRQGASEDLSRRLGNAGRFGFPALVVLDTDGSVLHIQDSSYLEEGEGYDREKVLRFFKNWTPTAAKQ